MIDLKRVHTFIEREGTDVILLLLDNSPQVNCGQYIKH